MWLPDRFGPFGATASQPYQVWLQSLQLKQGTRELIYEATRTDGVRLAWKAPTVLEICYAQAQITLFRNYFSVAEESPGQIYEVEILLKRALKIGDC